MLGCMRNLDDAKCPMCRKATLDTKKKTQVEEEESQLSQDAAANDAPANPTKLAAVLQIIQKALREDATSKFIVFTSVCRGRVFLFLAYRDVTDSLAYTLASQSKYPGSILVRLRASQGSFCREPHDEFWLMMHDLRTLYWRESSCLPRATAYAGVKPMANGQERSERRKARERGLLEVYHVRERTIVPTCFPPYVPYLNYRSSTNTLVIA